MKSCLVWLVNYYNIVCNQTAQKYSQPLTDYVSVYQKLKAVSTRDSVVVSYHRKCGYICISLTEQYVCSMNQIKLPVAQLKNQDYQASPVSHNMSNYYGVRNVS